MPYLIRISGKKEREIFPIKGDRFTIGADPSCDLQLKGEWVEPIHAVISLEGKEYSLSAAGPKAVTYLNYLPAIETKISAGDEITLGRNTFQFEIEESAVDSEVRDMVEIVSPESLETTVESALPREEDPIGVGKGNLVAEDRAEHDLEALYRAGNIVHGIDDLEVLADELVSCLLEVTKASRVCFLSLDSQNNLVPQSLASRPGKKAGKILISRSIVGRVESTGEGVLCTNASTDSRFQDAHSISLGNIRSAICVPVTWQENNFGIIYLDARGFTRDFVSFDQADLRLVQAIANQAALAMSNARKETELVRENVALKRKQQKLHFGMVAASPRMGDVIRVITRAAPTPSTVLIRGETGTGKEVVARALHFNSNRKEKPLVIVNCAAYPETLLQSELFGHEKGAFTGALNRKIGKFELAHGGTIFLDEIAELDPKSQVVLLRILEERKFQRLGSNQDISVDVRVVAATNRDLAKAIVEDDFREDLYYRLKVLEVFIPPLRERVEDIPALIDFYLSSFSREGLRFVEGIEPEALALLEKYDWPGNVRELKNAVERILVLGSSSLITGEDLGFISRESVSPLKTEQKKGSIRDLERAHIIQVLKDSDGNKKLAAEKLGINRSTLHRKIKTYGIIEGDREASR